MSETLDDLAKRTYEATTGQQWNNLYQVVQYAWREGIRTLLAEVLSDPEGYAHALGLPKPRHFYICNGCGKEHPKGEPCPDAHLLDTAVQRIGWLLFQAGKTASGTALEQYCALGMVAARELLSDPARWTRELGLPDPETYGECPDCLYDRGPKRAIPALQTAPASD